VIGSVYASVYSSRLGSALSGQLPPTPLTVAQKSVGAAFETVAQLDTVQHRALAQMLHDAASSAFFDGFSAACVLAAGVAAIGAVMAASLIPAQPPKAGAETFGEEPRASSGRPGARCAETTPERKHPHAHPPLPRAIVWSEYNSLDGVVAEPVAWSLPYFSDDFAQCKNDEAVSKATPCCWGATTTRTHTPIALERGKRLSEGTTEPIGLRLVDTRQFESGVVATTYHRGA
jgi:hypothetical protein